MVMEFSLYSFLNLVCLFFIFKKGDPIAAYHLRWLNLATICRWGIPPIVLYSLTSSRRYLIKGIHFPCRIHAKKWVIELPTCPGFLCRIVISFKSICISDSGTFSSSTFKENVYSLISKWMEEKKTFYLFGYALIFFLWSLITVYAWIWKYE